MSPTAAPPSAKPTSWAAARSGSGARRKGTPSDPFADEHLRVRQAHDRRRDDQRWMAAKGAVKATLGGALGLEVKLIPGPLAHLAQDRARVKRGKGRPEWPEQSVEESEILAHGPREPGAQHLDGDRRALQHPAVHLRGRRHGHRLKIELLKLVGRARLPSVTKRLLDPLGVHRLTGALLRRRELAGDLLTPRPGDPRLVDRSGNPREENPARRGRTGEPKTDLHDRVHAAQGGVVHRSRV